MPYYGCKSCHHEWEGSKGPQKCGWCGCENAKVLEDKTPVEKLCSGDTLIKLLEKINKKGKIS